MALRYQNRVIVVTGASSGIGEACARAFAREGAKVALVSERERDLANVTCDIRELGGSAWAFCTNLSNPDETAALVGRIEEALGPLDVLVNNAGIGLGATVLDTNPADLRHLFEINFFAVETLCRTALRGMAQRRSGTIVNVSSGAARMGLPGVAAYSASKGALHSYTQALRAEARYYGVCVTEVLPISVRTAFFDNAKGSQYKPNGVVLTAGAVAEAILRECARKYPRAELLPFRYIWLAFVADAVWPGILSRYLARTFARSERGAQRERM